jgi:hypothetical protein
MIRATSDSRSATAVVIFSELRAWEAAAAGAWSCIKQVKLAELQPQYNAGNLSTLPGVDVKL